MQGTHNLNIMYIQAVMTTNSHNVLYNATNGTQKLRSDYAKVAYLNMQ